MSRPGRDRQRQTIPGWVTEGTAITDPLEGRNGIVQWIGEWEDPQTRVVMANAVFVRPPGGGREWVVKDPSSLERA
ncbi:hypothetical protein BX286_2334 [Streptomyces sp. 3211.6]|uniref:hypothetical protein n=1 Tax=Streptomyces TaxID=1883 RepID=UPI0009A4C5E4|nr:MULTISPECIES: hypothetical protein [Streptomyces]RKT04384.1 hypothetical protein BX286_2334 [Streptomyces sp. 3211.6]RPF40269.1 hypothetical protein EDD96_4023 [Streptomyces sp. Ag109_G2-6]